MWQKRTYVLFHVRTYVLTCVRTYVRSTYCFTQVRTYVRTDVFEHACQTRAQLLCDEEYVPLLFSHNVQKFKKGPHSSAYVRTYVRIVSLKCVCSTYVRTCVSCCFPRWQAKSDGWAICARTFSESRLRIARENNYARTCAQLTHTRCACDQLTHTYSSVISACHHIQPCDQCLSSHAAL